MFLIGDCIGLMNQTLHKYKRIEEEIYRLFLNLPLDSGQPTLSRPSPPYQMIIDNTCYQGTTGIPVGY